MASTMTSTKQKTKLSVRNKPLFKKSSSSSSSSVFRRGENIFKKAYELSTLCDVDVCVICYGPDGELSTWPEDKAKVRDMAERFTGLSDGERRKKSTNLSQFLSKKINDEKKRSLNTNDNKFSEKVLEMEGSLESRLRIFQDKLRLLEPDQSPAVFPGSRTEQDQSSLKVSSMDPHQQLNHLSGVSSTKQDQSPSGYSGFNTGLSTSLMENHHQQWTEPLMNVSSTEQDQSRGFATGLSTTSLMEGCHQQWTEQLMNVSTTEQDLSRGLANDFSTLSSLNHPQSKFSIFLYNHEDGAFTRLSDSASSLEQPYNNLGANYDYSALLHGAQGYGGDGTGLIRSCNNIDLPRVIPTQNNTIPHFD